MVKKISGLLMLTIVSLLICSVSYAQDRKSVSAKEVNGTFQFNFSGKFKGTSNEIKILALGKGKLKISFDLVYPYLMNNGEVMVNMGNVLGTATIEADRAVYVADNEYMDEDCRIEIKFTKPGTIEVKQISSGAACGFGHNVSAEGVYKKVSAARPSFSEL